MEFQATYFDGIHSRAHPATISFDGQYLHIKGVEDHPDINVRLRECRISPPLGSTTRSIILPHGAQCETDDLDAVAELDKIISKNRFMRLINYFESRWKTAFIFMAALIVCIWAFINYGIPFLAEKTSYSIPSAYAEQLSTQTLKILDDSFLKPSELDQIKSAELQESFTLLLETIDPEFNYRLILRKSPIIGPNAFALPSGIIIMTDELAVLGTDNRGLEGILLHEIAHVKLRHGLRSIIQNAGVFILISAVVGDVTSITSAAASLPTLLAQSSYSRNFEREADQFTSMYFRDKGWSLKPFKDILIQITKDMDNYPGESFLSSHPMTDERIRQINQIDN